MKHYLSCAINALHAHHDYAQMVLEMDAYISNMYKSSLQALSDLHA